MRYDTLAGPALLCHGLGENDMNGVTPDDYGYALDVNDELQNILSSDIRFVVSGHTHQRMVRHFDGLTLVNAGTLLRFHQPTFVVLDFGDNRARFFNMTPSDISAAEEFALITKVR